MSQPRFLPMMWLGRISIFLNTSGNQFSVIHSKTDSSLFYHKSLFVLT